MGVRDALSSEGKQSSCNPPIQYMYNGTILPPTQNRRPRPRYRCQDGHPLLLHDVGFQRHSTGRGCRHPAVGSPRDGEPHHIVMTSLMQGAPHELGLGCGAASPIRPGCNTPTRATAPEASGNVAPSVPRCCAPKRLGGPDGGSCVWYTRVSFVGAGAPLGGHLLIVDINKEGADKSDDRLGVREDLHDVGACGCSVW